MTRIKRYNVYISSCCENGGIYHCSFDEKNGIKVIDKIPLDRPMYTVINGNRLYVLLRAAFKNSTDSGLISFDINKDGKLINKIDVISTKGEVACHLCVEDEDIYAVNYLSGSVILFPENVIVHNGKSINEARQEKAHTHYVTVTPDKKYVLVTDLGMDKIITYTRQLEYVCETQIKPGNGPRHLVFSPDGKFVFCANELSSTVTMYKYNDGKLSLTDEKSALPDNYKGESYCAAIRFSNGKIYVSNRGDDSICEFEYTDKGLNRTRIFPCFGSYPRDFDIIGNVLISTNQGGSVTLVNLDTEELMQKIEIENPLCISYGKI